MRRTPTIAVFSLAVGVTLSTGARGLPLDPPQCDSARSEQLLLDKKGVREDVLRGADWARGNLGEERLKDVARWIDLQEQILFRCPRPKPPPAEAGAIADGQSGEKNKSGAEGTGSTEAEAQATAGKPKKPVQKKTSDNSAEPQKKQRKSLTLYPKTDDAYRPPAPGVPEYQHAAPGAPPASGTTGSALAP